MGVLTSIGSLIGVYIMGMAVLSPCPLLVNDTSGTVIIVSIKDEFVFIFNIRSVFAWSILLFLFVYLVILCFTGVGVVLFYFRPILR